MSFLVNKVNAVASNLITSYRHPLVPASDIQIAIQQSQQGQAPQGHLPHNSKNNLETQTIRNRINSLDMNDIIPADNYEPGAFLEAKA
jgi:hypothetical protein